MTKKKMSTKMKKTWIGSRNEEDQCSDDEYCRHDFVMTSTTRLNAWWQ